AANLPDADLLYTGVGGDRLAYMLHHRGCTHTFVLALLGGVVMWGIAALALRRRAGQAHDRDDAHWLLALLLVSTTSHIMLDWTNSYGVHPFWPLDDRWFYGDAVFIVEPWLWVAAVPALVAATTSRIARALLSLVLVSGVALAWRVSLASAGAAAALTIGALLSVLFAWRLRPGARIATAMTAWVAVTLVMAAGSALARRHVMRAVAAVDPAIELVDVVVSPLPANAVCFSVITVERLGATYRVVTARASSAPSIADAARCPARGGSGGLLRASARHSTRAVRWDAEWRAPVAELATLARESCPALAALRFIRAPAWRAVGDSAVMIGDVRYGSGSGSGFSDVRVPRHSPHCPDAVPPWVPPRAALLGLR
ncbi:MAG TPA: metal-dependent hydrolase, partial [Gemmatimonadaceae bacterium]|nr:metal-dependent hydrolase [Gemmatimonadaceae bacterium]